MISYQKNLSKLAFSKSKDINKYISKIIKQSPLVSLIRCANSCDKKFEILVIITLELKKIDW